MKIVLKELRESLICLKIIKRAVLANNNDDKMIAAMKECDELISIFVKSIETAQKNVNKGVIQKS